MRLVRLLVAAAFATAAPLPALARQVPAPVQPEPTTQAPGQTPTAPSSSPAAPQVPGSPTTTSPTTTVALTPASARTFTAPVGMWVLPVRPDRAADFEQVVARLQAALADAKDPRTREQAKSWRMLKAGEPGPNANVLYVFLIDATVPGADYGLGGILAGAYADTTELAEIWRMYTGAITGGGSLLNLTPIAPKIAPFGTKTTPIPVTPSATTAPTTQPSPTTPTPPPTTAPPTTPAPVVPQP